MHIDVSLKTLSVLFTYLHLLLLNSCRHYFLVRIMLNGDSLLLITVHCWQLFKFSLLGRINLFLYKAVISWGKEKKRWHFQSRKVIFFIVQLRLNLIHVKSQKHTGAENSIWTHTRTHARVWYLHRTIIISFFMISVLCKMFAMLRMSLPQLSPA